MNDFARFSQLVHRRFVELSLHELFVTAQGDDVWATYLVAFPAGTNPIFRERTEHDCSCCKNFVRNTGNVVAIVDGELTSVWDVAGAESPYAEVAAALHAFVVGQPISGVFRTKERSYGAEKTFEQVEGSAKTWNHFHGRIADKHFAASPATAKGQLQTTFDVFTRGLDEITLEAIDVVLDLAQSNALYRGEEHAEQVRRFRALKVGLPIVLSAQPIYLWENIDDRAARLKNSVIGTLLVDLSSGVEMERAVKSFETKVAPTNYKRPTALITKGMVEQAMKTIGELDLEGALQRRFAKLSDISVNEVLWVDGAVRSKMKNGLADLLMAEVRPATSVNAPDLQAVGIDDFMANIAPKAKSMDVFMRNALRVHLMSLTAPVDASSARLFRWGNDFGWAYNGNIADSEIRRAVQAHGGRVDGAFRFSHSWNYAKRNASLMDLHVFMPGSRMRASNGASDEYGNNERVGWNRRNHASSGGVQDVDYTAAAPVGYVPVENITFPVLARMPEGDYVCKIHNWNNRPPTEGGFKAEIEFAGQTFEYEVARPLKHKEWVSVATVTLRNGTFTIEHHIPSSISSQAVWGVKTETFVPVTTLMRSPNHWDGNSVGNKHWFFILQGCATPEPTRGIFNEHLRADLEKHRKVFEVLGNKTLCHPTADQLSGVGFSSARNDEVVVRVATAASTKLFNIKF